MPGGCANYALLFVQCLLVIHAHPSFALDIYVNQRNGTAEDCCSQGETCLTLNQALDCLRENNHSTVWMEPDTYYLGSDDENIHANYTFNLMQDVAIVALSTASEIDSTHESPVIVVCNNVSVNHGAGLTFLNSTNVTIRGIMFDGCGVYHYSTSRAAVHPSSKFFQFFTTLYFMLCTDVVLEYVHVNGTKGIGAVMYSTVGSNVIRNCNFSHNAVGAGMDIPGGGGVYIEFSYCLPYNGDKCDSSTNVPTHNRHNAHYKIDSTTFYKNNATVTNATDLTFILPHLNDHVAFGRGGGLSIFFKGFSSNNTVLVSNATFADNYALWGAGLFVEYQDGAYNNTFEIQSSVLDSNICYNSESESKGTGGGGARVGYIFFNDTYGLVTSNNMTFTDVQFLNNKAYFGGGLSFYTAREPDSHSPTNILSFNRCSWQSNVARVGSAVDLSIWHPIASGTVVKPSFTDCEFINNSALYTARLGSQVGIGALYIDSIPISFKQSVWFISNTQTALASISTGIYFEEGCYAHFMDNQGRNGGAIALMGNSFFRVSRQTEMKFVKNSAELKGGAIYGQSIGEHDLISSRNCFIRYEDVEAVPQNWTARFWFENNTATNGKVNSIHVTSLLTCLWGGAFGSTETIQEAADKVFCWSNDTWLYSSNDCSLEISTSPARFIVQDNSTEVELPTYNATVIPGMRTYINMSTSDDRDNDVTEETVFTARLLDTSDTLSLDNSSLYISDRGFELYGEPGSMGTLRLETIDPRVISTDLNVTLQHCPPGMVLGSSSTCQCIGNYGGYVDCNSTTFSAKILRGSWIGSSNKSLHKDKFLVGQCPYCSLVGSEQYIPLPQHASMVPDFICEKINREGELCGHCKDGYGLVVNGNFECVHCPASEAKYHWIFYLLTEFFPIAIFFFIVVFFNISATSGPGNAFVFFAQVITTAFSLTGDGTVQINNIANKTLALTIRSFYSIPYDIWNLNFFHPLLPKFCLSSEITTLQLLSTGYVTAFFPLLLVVIFYLFVWLYARGIAPIVCLCRPLHHCFARFRGMWNIERSVLHALATFLLLSYTKFSLVSFILLTPTPLLYNDGSRDWFVLYYDGTIDFFRLKHAPYIAASFTVLLTFVALPPLVLMLPSISHMVCVCLKKTRNYECNNCISYQVGSVTGQFMTAFHECYKDGTGALSGDNDNKHDYRWFSGMYFILRLIVFAVYAFTPDWFMQYTILQLVCISGLMAFTLLRPYKKDWYNKLDAAIFGILAAINTLSMYNYFLAVVEETPSVWIFSLQYILVLCPLLYMVVFVLHYLLKKYGKSAVQCFKGTRPFSKCFTGEDNEAGDNRDFIEYTEGTGRLDGELEYSINIAEARKRQRSILEELNHSEGIENRPLLLQDPTEVPEQNSGNSNTSSGYGATGSAREASPGLSANSENDDVSTKLPFFGVERLRLEDQPTVQERRRRLFRTQ